MATTPSTGDRLEALEREVGTFAKATRQQLLYKLAGFGLRDRLELAKTRSKLRLSRTRSGSAIVEQEEFLYQSVRSYVRKKGGELEGVGFSFARHGIFFERGVGKNRPLGSAAATRTAKPWIQPTLDPAIRDLATLLENEYADIAAGELKITVPGILSTKINFGNG